MCVCRVCLYRRSLAKAVTVIQQVAVAVSIPRAAGQQTHGGGVASLCAAAPQFALQEPQVEKAFAARRHVDDALYICVYSLSRSLSLCLALALSRSRARALSLSLSLSLSSGGQVRDVRLAISDPNEQ